MLIPQTIKINGTKYKLIPATKHYKNLVDNIYGYIDDNQKVKAEALLEELGRTYGKHLQDYKEAKIALQLNSAEDKPQQSKSPNCLHTVQEEKLKAHFTRKVTPCEMAKLDQFNIDEECIPIARVIDFCVVDIDGIATEVTDFNITYKNDIRINGKQVHMSLNDINRLDEDMCK